MTETMNPPAPPKRRWPVLVGILAVVVLAAAGTLWWLARGEDPASAAAFTVTGKVTVRASGAAYNGGQCQGAGGFDDIHPGASVVVSDASGTTIAIGRLEMGVGRTGGCEMPFLVGNVPGGHSFYGVTVGNRKGQQYSAADVVKPLSLSLG